MLKEVFYSKSSREAKELSISTVFRRFIMRLN